MNSNRPLSFGDYIPFTVGLTILLAFWVDGHYSYQKKLEKELDSTKARDTLRLLGIINQQFLNG